MGGALVGLLGTSLALLLEGGLDDGPYVGRPAPRNVVALAPSDSVAYRGGHLVVINRADALAPVLLRRRDGRLLWAREMYADLGVTPDHPTGGDERPDFVRMTDLSVERGVFRHMLHFTGGAERGRVYLWRWGGVQKFYHSG